MKFEDYVASFSTFFAVKAPWLEAEYDSTMISIHELFANFGAGIGRTPSRSRLAQSGSPYVYLHRSPEELEKVPMVRFGQSP